MPVATFPDPTNATGVVGLFAYDNSITNQGFMPAIIFVVWIVLFMTLKFQWETQTALGSSLFIAMLITILLRGAGLVSDAIVLITILAFAGALFLMLFKSEKGT